MEPNQDRGITNELISNIVSDVKLVCGVTGDNSGQVNKLLTLYTKIICNKLLDRTNRRIFPEGLRFLVIDMVTDEYNEYQSGLSSGSAGNPQSIQSISEAGRSVNFGTDSATLARLTKIADRKLNEYETIIGKYRLLYKS